MKISPIIYAKTLVGSAGANNTQIARRFWLNLQKNKQYKDLAKILDLMDSEAALIENKKLVKIYSKNTLDQIDLNMVQEKLEKKLNSKIILTNIAGKNITGAIAQVDDKIIDLSLENKVKQLKKLITKSR
jgi:F0F1-type ATP synthase delta subunit